MTFTKVCCCTKVRWWCLNTSVTSQNKYILSQIARKNSSRLKKLLRIVEDDSTNNAIEFRTMPIVAMGRLPQVSIHQAQLLRNLVCSGESSTSSQVSFVTLPILKSFVSRETQ